ncbi:hypothetical protein [Bacillus sp. UNC438CL73TsuS30]|uniref:hypothetical protein n=1 Tax=Bacillus sp. UNC438CL73TsuS30 TaxID=1340434 RepID=UPI00047C20B0|nr:hypothetical protein [Bacillus sp. UNC438CL73TsuS30]
MTNPKEAVFWSIAFPGFGQLNNGKYLKGILFITLEIIVNVKAHFNEIIRLSFHGEIENAIAQANYQWLMFYPCLYLFAMWDSFKDAGGGTKEHSFFPFVMTAYFVTVGCIYSSNFKLFGTLLGPVWLPILCVIPGLIVGTAIRGILQKRVRQES